MVGAAAGSQASHRGAKDIGVDSKESDSRGAVQLHRVCSRASSGLL